MARCIKVLVTWSLCLTLSLLGSAGAYWMLGWLGVVMLGTLVAFVGFRLELEEEAPVVSATTQYSELYAELFRRHHSLSRAEKAARQAEIQALHITTLPVKVFGLAMLAVGIYGIWIQLSR